jgi:acetylornithine deacetylase
VARWPDVEVVLEDVQAQVRALLTQLVAVDTTSARSNAPLIGLLEERVRALGFTTRRHAYRDDAGVEKVNLLAVSAGSIEDLAQLALVGHSDCVPYDAAWTDALRLTERDGCWFGRGACDTKAFIASALTAVERVGRSALRRPLMLGFTADEEVGCVGAKRMVEAGLGRARYAIIGEPTSLTPIHANKGYCLAEVEVLGKEGHSAYPDTGASAIFRAARLITRFEELSRTGLRATTDASFEPPYTTVNVGMIGGGKAKNIIAGRCTFTVEWRSTPGQPTDQVAQLLEGLITELQAEEPGFEAHVRRLRQDPGVKTSVDSEVVQFLTQESGKAPATVAFGTESPMFTALGAEAVVFGPGDIRRAHQTHEFVPIDQVTRCEQILERAIRRFCS